MVGSRGWVGVQGWMVRGGGSRGGWVGVVGVHGVMGSMGGGGPGVDR